MKNQFCFNRAYFILTIILFVVEGLIAKYVHDKIIRPYGGDYLVVMLLYCFVRSFVNYSVLKTAVAVLLFSVLVETLQYFHFVEWIGLSHSKLAGVVIGTSFMWADIVAYMLGMLTVLLLEKTIGNKMRAASAAGNNVILDKLN